VELQLFDPEVVMATQTQNNLLYAFEAAAAAAEGITFRPLTSHAQDLGRWIEGVRRDVAAALDGAREAREKRLSAEEHIKELEDEVENLEGDLRDETLRSASLAKDNLALKARLAELEAA
jgi:septal ring factor EnvC (AmiA/AmiB activator)